MRLLALLLLAVSLPAAAQRAQAELECKAAGTDFTYDCVIRLERAGKPLTGVIVTLGADMPSMPMAHHVKPARATATGKPGEYRARVELEMQGEWALKLRLGGAVRDQLILHYEFDDKGARPARRR